MTYANDRVPQEQQAKHQKTCSNNNQQQNTKHNNKKQFPNTVLLPLVPSHWQFPPPSTFIMDEVNFVLPKETKRDSLNDPASFISTEIIDLLLKVTLQLVLRDHQVFVPPIGFLDTLDHTVSQPDQEKHIKKMKRKFNSNYPFLKQFRKAVFIICNGIHYYVMCIDITTKQPVIRLYDSMVQTMAEQHSKDAIDKISHCKKWL